MLLSLGSCPPAGLPPCGAIRRAKESERAIAMKPSSPAPEAVYSLADRLETLAAIWQRRRRKARLRAPIPTSRSSMPSATP